MIDFISVLNHEHLDNGFFLTAFAKSLKKRNKRGLILHEGSEYTERIIQTGVMREDAVIRCYKDLNHRLVALFADDGISTIGLNGFQKSMVSIDGEILSTKFNTLKTLPKEPMILLSSLGLDIKRNKPIPIPISELANTLKKEFHVKTIDLFTKKENSEIIKDDLPRIVNPIGCGKQFQAEHIPESFKLYNGEVRIQGPHSF